MRTCQSPQLEATYVMRNMNHPIVSFLKGTILPAINQCPGVIQTLLSVYNLFFLQLQNHFHSPCRKFCLAQHSYASPSCHPCCLKSKKKRLIRPTPGGKMIMKRVWYVKEQYSMTVKNLDSVIELTYISDPALSFTQRVS